MSDVVRHIPESIQGGSNGKNRLALAILLAGAACGGWTHGSAVLTFANWTGVIEGIPCMKVQKVGDHRLKIVGPIVVGGTTYQERVISDHDEVEALEKRCFSRHG
jgi:hypothetical protein